MLKKSFYSLFIAIFSCIPISNAQQSFTSPSENLTLRIDSKSNDLLLGLSGEGVSTHSILQNYGSKIQKVTSQQIERSWITVVGERKEVEDHFTEVTIDSEDDFGKSLSVKCRLYDVGFAFQIVYDADDFRDVVLEKEAVHWAFEDDHRTWVTTMSQGEYQESRLSAMTEKAERPLLIQANENMFYAICISR